jgi:hypothetical protein
MERKCSYRNCGKDISHMRKDAKYCNRNCKGCEGKYVKRQDNLIKEAMMADFEKVRAYKLFVEILKKN